MAGPGKCFLVTGPPGVGKTTLIMKVFESLKVNPSLKLQGFYTREIRRAGQRVGFEVVTLDGRTAPLASIDISTPESLRWPNVGKYKVDVASFESLALPELQVKEDTDLFIIDEVVARLRNHAGATCFTLSVSNRDAVREQIRSQLEDMLTKH